MQTRWVPCELDDMNDGDFVVPGKTSADGGIVYMVLQSRELVDIAGWGIVSPVWSEWKNVTTKKGDTTDGQRQNNDTTDS